MNEIIGVITVIVGVSTYLPYLWQTFKGEVTPHPFTWIIWVTLTLIAYAAQLSDNAGPGAWMNAAVLTICFFIIVFSFKNGFDNITRFDIGIFCIGVVAIILWLVTQDALFSVILVSIAYTIAIIPTIRKSYHKPYEEAMYLYGINFFRHGASIFAMANISPLTILFPAVLSLNNGAFALFLLWRRHCLKKQQAIG